MSKSKNVSKLSIFPTNKEKYIELLHYEKAFLEMFYYKTNSLELRDRVEVALELVDSLLRSQSYIEADLSDREYQKFTYFIQDLIDEQVH